MIKAVIFDLWNTLAFNKGVYVNPLIEIERILGLEMNDYKLIEKGMMTRKFSDIQNSISNLCRVAGVEPKKEIVDELLRLYEVMEDTIEFFPDVIPNLEKLRKKFKIGLVSNVGQYGIERLFKLQFHKFFDYISFSYETGLLKPDPRVFREVLEKLDANPEEAVMVGDNFFDDVLAAENVGIKGILIKRDLDAFRPSWKETHAHENMIKSLDEIWGFLK